MDPPQRIFHSGSNLMTIQAAYRGSFFLLCLWGLTALLLTGEYSLGLISLAYAGVTLAFLASVRGVRVRVGYINLLTLAVFAGVAVIARQSLLDGAVFFFMYLQVAKLLTFRTTRDALWIYTVIFFQIVAAAVLTTSIGFLLVFVVYVALMLVSLSLYNLHRSGEMADRHLAGLDLEAAERVGFPRPVMARIQDGGWRRRRLPRRFILSSAGLFAVVTTVTVLFFLWIPRLSTQRILTPTGPRVLEESVSAFSESVEFGAFGKINLDGSVAMYVRPLDGVRPAAVRLRGVALDTFDGQRWMRTTAAVSGTPFERFNRRSPTPRTFLIIQPPFVTNFIFGVTFPNVLSVPRDLPVIFDPVSNSAWLPTALSREIHYFVESRVEDLDDRADPETLYPRRPADEVDAAVRLGGTVRDLVRTSVRRRMQAPDGVQRLAVPADPAINRRARADFLARIALPAEYRQRCLEIPPTVDRNKLTDLARGWTEGTTTPFQAAMAIENRLKREYQYTLDRPVEGNHIEDFLFRTRAGHCEYFASAMVMLLRSLGIPSRFVNGYYCAEWNQIANAFTVRQSDAHSWVEAYFDRYGWMTFEPTPAAGIGRAAPLSPLMLAYGQVMDAMKVRWYRYVIDYNFRDQLVMIRSVVRLQAAVSRFFDRLSFGQNGFDAAQGYDGTTVFGLALILIICAGGAVGGLLVLQAQAQTDAGPLLRGNLRDAASAGLSQGAARDTGRVCPAGLRAAGLGANAAGDRLVLPRALRRGSALARRAGENQTVQREPAAKESLTG
jgi:transglutaminase-like putative cysteine protease